MPLPGSSSALTLFNEKLFSLLLCHAASMIEVFFLLLLEFISLRNPWVDIVQGLRRVIEQQQVPVHPLPEVE